VPEFRALELGPRRSRWCVCIPVLNEGARIRAQLERMRPYTGGLDVAIADGGSTDGALAPSWLRTTIVRALLTKTGPGRLSAQMRMAIGWALEQGYEGLIFVDGNDKDDPEALPRFAAELEQGADHVQGSRYLPGGRGENTPLARHLGVKLVHAPLISLAARRATRTRPTASALQSAPPARSARAAVREVFVGYELHYYLAIRAARLGFVVREIPVVRSYPRGRAPTKISGWRGNLACSRRCSRRRRPLRSPAS
jgi:glycosyltransferase involved in cell wall biosynthesis